MRFRFHQSACKFGLILFFSLQLINANAQKRFNIRDKDSYRMEAIEEWLSLVDKEKPFLDSLKKGGGYWTLNDDISFMANLLRDKYFVPVFGESITSMSAERLKKTGSSMMDLIKNKKYADKWEKVNSAYLSFANSIANGEGFDFYKRRLEEIERHEKNYNKMMSDLSDVNISFKQIQYTNQVRALLPSEIYNLNKAYKEKRDNSEYLAVINRVQPILKMQASMESVHKIISERNSKYTGLAQLSPIEKSSIISMLNKKLAEDLAMLIQAEEEKIGQMQKENDFSVITRQYKNFRSNYYIFLDSPAVKNLNYKWKETWLHSFELNNPMLENRIRQATGEEELKYLNTTYFSFTGVSHDRLNNLKTQLNDRISSIKRIIDEAKLAERKEKERRFYSMPNRLKIDVSYYQDAFTAAYSRDYEKLDKIAEKDINIPRLLFKLLIELYSDSCEKYLPAERIGIPLTQTSVRTEITGFYPNQRRTNIYEEHIVKTVYMDAKYAESYKNTHIVTKSGIDGSNYLNSILNMDQTTGEIQKIVKQGEMMRQNARSLISMNGCRHPGIIEILNNLDYYFNGYSSPVEWKLPEEGFANGRNIFNEKEKYYRDTLLTYVKKDYVDAPPYFVPETFYTPGNNNIITVYHASKPSPGIASIFCHNLHLTTLAKGKYYNDKENKYNIPPEIEAEYKKNWKKYYIIEVVYNLYKNGILESKQETFWFDNDTLPSVEFRQFFADQIKKPVKKLDINYDVKE